MKHETGWFARHGFLSRRLHGEADEGHPGPHRMGDGSNGLTDMIEIENSPHVLPATRKCTSMCSPVQEAPSATRTIYRQEGSSNPTDNTWAYHRARKSAWGSNPTP